MEPVVGVRMLIDKLVGAEHRKPEFVSQVNGVSERMIGLRPPVNANPIEHKLSIRPQGRVVQEADAIRKNWCQATQSPISSIFVEKDGENGQKRPFSPGDLSKYHRALLRKSLVWAPFHALVAEIGD